MKRVRLIIGQYKPSIAEFRARTNEPAVWNGGGTGSAQNRTVWSPFPSLSVTADNGQASSELPLSWARSVTADPHDCSRGRSQCYSRLDRPALLVLVGEPLADMDGVVDPEADGNTPNENGSWAFFELRSRLRLWVLASDDCNTATG